MTKLRLKWSRGTNKSKVYNLDYNCDITLTLEKLVELGYKKFTLDVVEEEELKGGSKKQ